MELELSDAVASGVCRALGVQPSTSAFLASRSEEKPAEVKSWIDLNAPEASPERRLQVSRILDAVIRPERVVQVRIRAADGEQRTISLCHKTGEFFPVRVTADSTLIGDSLDGPMLIDGICDLLFADTDVIRDEEAGAVRNGSVPLRDAVTALAFNNVGVREGSCTREELEDSITSSLSTVGVEDAASVAREFVSRALHTELLESTTAGLQIGQRGREALYRNALFARSVTVTSVDPGRIELLDSERFSLEMAASTKVFVGSDAPYLLTFGESAAELRNLDREMAEAILSIHISDVVYPATMPKIPGNEVSNARPRQTAPFRFLSNYELAMLRAGATIDDITDHATLFSPRQVIALSVGPNENRDIVFVNVNGDVAAAWVPCDAGVALQTVESADVDSIVEDAIAALLGPFEVSNPENRFTISSNELAEQPSSWSSAPAAFAGTSAVDWTQFELSNHRADGDLVTGVELEGIAAPELGIWLFEHRPSSNEITVVPCSRGSLSAQLFDLPSAVPTSESHFE